MKTIRKKFSRAEITGMVMLPLAAAAWLVHPLMTTAIALSYVVLCVLGCFFPQTNFLLPVIHRGSSGKNYVSLTFDDGPSGSLTKQILDLLDQYQTKATFFVSGIQALRHPEILGEIIRRGHTLGNHSFSHDPFLMMKSYRTLYKEIVRAQDTLRQAGVTTLAFRPPVGIVNPKLPKALDELQMFCVTFSCRAQDAGNRFVKKISKKILNKIKPDDIILLHDALPADPGRIDIFLQEVEKLLEGITQRGLLIVPLEQLLNKSIMICNHKV